MPSTTPERRSAYPHFHPIQTRWMDNDLYGHVNNGVYYAYFDTVVNDYLISKGGLDIHAGAVIALCVESHCQFLASVAFPEALEGGLRVAHLGRTSVRYEVGIFRANAQEASAQGHFIHVLVDRASRRPVAFPAGMRNALELLSPKP
jgi:acyl-CoA thioester hydrolase